MFCNSLIMETNSFNLINIEKIKLKKCVFNLYIHT